MIANRLALKPRDIKQCCCDETKMNKAKILVISLFMGAISSSYQTYFDGLVWRSGNFQKQALAGKLAFLDYYDKDDPSPTATSMWELRNRLDLVEDKSLKDLKFI